MTDTVPGFQAFTAPHYAALGVSAVTGLAMICTVRRGKAVWARGFETSLAAVLLSLWPLSVWLHNSSGTLTVENQYPCHLCDIAQLLGALALLTHRRGLFELLYFWGIAGTAQGLITPALTVGWPHPRFLLFFLTHGGVVVAALYGVLGLGILPRPGAKWRAWGLLALYAAAVGFFNHLVGANYGFLCRKPPTASLFDVLGPWPWYVGSTALLALALFWILDLPFVKRRAQCAEPNGRP